MSIEERNSYTEIEVQTLRFAGNITSGNQNGSQRTEFEEEVLGPDGLDRDLVAELVAMRVRANLFMDDQDNATNTTPGSAIGSYTLGINTTRGDFGLFSDAPSVDEANVTTGAGTAEGNVADDPGALYQSQLVVLPAFNDTVNGSGGGGTSQQSDEMMMEYRDLFGMGPIVDATDDLQANLAIQHNAVGGSSNANLEVTLWWDIHEVEGGRPQFGLPTPH